MALIEGFRVQNYRSLRDVRLGRVLDNPNANALTPLTAVIGKNGSGKSTLCDAFGFLADCMNAGVEPACDQENRGGFDQLRSRGATGPVRFEVSYRESPDVLPFLYDLAIDVDGTGRPFVSSETLRQHPDGLTQGIPFPYMRQSGGKGIVWSNEILMRANGEEAAHHVSFSLPESRSLAISIVSLFAKSEDEVSRIVKFWDFMKGCYLSHFDSNSARVFPIAGPQRHLNAKGDNIANVVQYMQREHKDRLANILQRIADRIPGITSIDTKVTEDKRLLLRFNDQGFQDPFFAQQMSDGTLKVFAYLLLLEDPDPPPFICIEEPENGLYPKLLETLAQEFRSHATGAENAPQIIVTTHQPYFVDALSPEEVWILDKGADGFSTIRRASDIALVRNMVAEGLPLGGLWYSDYLDPR